MIPFTRHGVLVIVRLSDLEAEVLRDLAGQLTELLGDRATTHEAPTDAGSAAALFAQLGIGGSTVAPLDPALARLLPDAYKNDLSASSEHRRLTEGGLVDRKIAHARLVVASLTSSSITLDEAAAQSWLRTLTDLRLTIASRLRIIDDGDEGTGDEALLDVYDWLGYLQGTLLDAIE
ncbi:DUF2017 domain-containing protein [Salinibacterium sp.]|uniref:DUF2017 domain-containing protein n=1 Tax=Salinibacterium sp. TaxID=1915057 RepID=UPI00286AE5A6|nr:DUF2017 domain-containing protein [Salinibacterium sp.]